MTTQTLKLYKPLVNEKYFRLISLLLIYIIPALLYINAITWTGATLGHLVADRGAYLQNTPTVEVKPNHTREEQIMLKTRIQGYLQSKGSPLAQVSDTLALQKDWKLLVAISYVESSMCKAYKVATANCWGIGKTQVLGKNLAEGVVAAQAFLTKYGYDQMTPEQSNGVYCQNQKFAGNKCPLWSEGVQQILDELKEI